MYNIQQLYKQYINGDSTSKIILKHVKILLKNWSKQSKQWCCLKVYKIIFINGVDTTSQSLQRDTCNQVIYAIKYLYFSIFQKKKKVFYFCYFIFYKTFIINKHIKRENYFYLIRNLIKCTCSKKKMNL